MVNRKISEARSTCAFYEVPYVPESGKSEKKADTKERRAKLEKIIRDNRYSSTLEQEQLKEIEEQERKEQFQSGEVLY